MQNNKSLVVFFSLDGNTKFIAENIKEEINSDLLELKMEKKARTGAFKKFFFNGMDALLKKKIELLPLDINLKEYEYLFIGTPVWAGTLTPAVRTFINNNKIAGKRIVLFACYAGSENKTFLQMRELLNDNTIISEKGFKEPLQNDEVYCVAEIKNWLKEIANKEGLYV